MAFETTLTKTDLYLSVIINGIVTGFSVAIGTYLAQKHFIDGIKNVLEKLNGILRK